MKQKVVIIAEAGVNHNGEIKLARELVDVAADAGADFVKFQTFKAAKVVTRAARRAEYQINNIGDGDDSQYNMLKKLEMPEFWHHDLDDYAKKRGIAFLSTGFDIESIDFLNKLGVPFFKIPSGEITNKPLLEHIARKGKPIVVSTGMSSIDEIKASINVLESAGVIKSNITVLHCNTQYPTPMIDVNLKAMRHIAEEIGVAVGYSDHTLGIEVPIAAVALGAVVIEKHFTIDRNLPGPDHKASLEPLELKAMIQAIRNIEMAIGGSGRKEVSPSEISNRLIARRSIHLSKDIPVGSIISKSDLIMKRPGDGISPMEINNVIGKRAKIDLTSESKLDWEQIA